MLNKLLWLTVPAGCLFLLIGIASFFDVRILLVTLALIFTLLGLALIAMGLTIAKWKAKIDAFKSKWFGGHFLHKK